MLDATPTRLTTLPRWRSFWAIAGALTLARLIILALSPAGLGPDEAQYWFWSQTPAFGYYSKPPMIGWIIALTTGIFGDAPWGDAPWAVRLAAPLLHLGSASFLYLTASAIFDRRAGFWTGIGWLTLPGVILSSFLITTDAPLMLFWTGALFFLVRITEKSPTRIIDFTALGVMIGLGLMAKYAMIYFPVAMIVSLAVIRPYREKLLRPQLIVTALVALVLFAPNIIWNSQHDFQTLSHTADNANWGAELFKPKSFLKFFLGQFAVMGIIPFAALIYFVARRNRRPHNATIAMLLIFALTPLIVVGAQAFISRAHANWAAAAYPAALMLVTGLLLQYKRGWLIKASIAFHGLALICFCAGLFSFGLADRVGLSSAVKDLRGWEAQTDAIMEAASGYDAVLIDDRYLMSEMVYYQRDAATPIVAIDPNAHIDNHFEAFRAFDPARHKRVLFATTRNDAAHVDYRFHTIIAKGAVKTDLGGGRTRRYRLYELNDYFGPGATD